MPSTADVDSHTPDGLEVVLDEVNEPSIWVLPLLFHNALLEPTWRPQPSNGEPGVKKSPSTLPDQSVWSRSITKPRPLPWFWW